MTEKKITIPIVLPPKPHISASQMGTYLDCGERYRRRYIEKDILPPGIALIRGTSIHKAAEVQFKQKIQSHQDLPVKQIVDLAVATFEERVKTQGVYLDDEEQARGQAAVVGEAKDGTVRLADLFGREVGPAYQPKLVEEKQVIALPNAPRDLLGVLDLVDEGDRVIDHKTSKKTANQKDWDTSTQLSVYALTFQAKNGKPPTDIIVEQLVDTKTPKRVTFHTERIMADYRALVARINTVVDGIEKGMFLPANTGWWGCSPKYCGYWKTCNYVNSERKAAAEGKE